MKKINILDEQGYFWWRDEEYPLTRSLHRPAVENGEPTSLQVAQLKLSHMRYPPQQEGLTVEMEVRRPQASHPARFVRFNGLACAPPPARAHQAICSSANLAYCITSLSSCFQISGYPRPSSYGALVIFARSRSISFNRVSRRW